MMQHLCIAAALSLLITAPAFALDCANATQSNDLIQCAQQQRQTAQANFTAEAKKLSQTAAIDSKTRATLAKFYSTARKQLSQSCQTTYTGSRLQAMYVNSCIAQQIDLLTQSQHAFICSVQQDAEGCA